MRPLVTYDVVRNTLRARVKVFRLPPGLYNTGIRVPKGQFDKAKQICGVPEIQLYMNKAATFMSETFRPGMTPQDLWNAFLQSETAKKIHSVKDAFEYYLMESVVSHSTREIITLIQTRLEAAGLLYIDIHDLTPAHISKFIREIGVGESTSYLYFGRIRAVLNKYAHAHNLKLADLEGTIKPPKKTRVIPGEERYMTLEEIQGLLRMDFSKRPALDYGRDLFCLMAFTGMAVSDLLKFTPDMVDKDGWLTYSRTKSRERAEVPLIAQAKQIIAKHTWPTKLSQRSVQHQCTVLSKLIGKHITPHTARHSWGCIALELGFSMESVSKMMGHTSIRTTEAIYARVTRQKIQREIRALPPALQELMTNNLV